MRPTLLAKKGIKESEREFLWDTFLPLAAYVCVLVSAAAWASFADEIRAISSVLLLLAALRDSWAITLTVIGC